MAKFSLIQWARFQGAFPSSIPGEDQSIKSLCRKNPRPQVVQREKSGGCSTLRPDQQIFFSTITEIVSDVKDIIKKEGETGTGNRNPN